MIKNQNEKRLKRNRLKLFNLACAGLSTEIRLALLLLLIASAGCARNSRTLVHPLSDDFTLVKAGDSVTAVKDGALVSRYFLCQVMAADVNSDEYCKGIK